jgi:hypothetical protein
LNIKRNEQQEKSKAEMPYFFARDKTLIRVKKAKHKYIAKKLK